MRSFVESVGAAEMEPTHDHSCDFDWAGLESALGELPQMPDGSTTNDAERFQQAMKFILDWLLSVNLDNHRALTAIGKRAIAMAWVIDPERFKRGDARQSPSLRQLSKQLGFTAPNISPLAADFSRISGLKNQFQRHDWRNTEGEKHHEFCNN